MKKNEELTRYLGNSFWLDFWPYLKLKESGKYMNTAPIFIGRLISFLEWETMREWVRTGKKSEPDFKKRLLELRQFFKLLIQCTREHLCSLDAKNQKEVEKVKEEIITYEFQLKEIDDAITSCGRNRISPEFIAVKAKAEQLDIRQYSSANANRIQRSVKPEMHLRTVKRHLRKLFAES